MFVYKMIEIVPYCFVSVLNVNRNLVVYSIWKSCRLDIVSLTNFIFLYSVY